MTALTTTRKVSFTGDGSTTAFPTGFIFFEDTDIEVLERTIATGVEVTKVLTTDYTVAGGDPVNGAVGTINAVVAPAATVEWVIRRVLPRTQEHELPIAGPLPVELVENADDRAVLLIQEVEEAGSRALTFPATDPASTSSIIPNSIDRADKVQAYDSTGKPVVSTQTLAQIESGSSDAAASAAAAAVSESNAATSETNAADSAADAALATITGVVSVVDFAGVDNTGVTNSTAGIQLAVDSGNAILFFPAGKYRINGTVNITSPIRIIGPGMDFENLGLAAANITTTSDTNDIFTINSSNVIIDGLNFNGTGARDALGQGKAIVIGSDAVTRTDGVATASSTTFTSATAGFVASDATGSKKHIRIDGAGPGGISLYARIETFVNATEVILSIAPSTTVNPATFEFSNVYTSTTLRNVSMSSHSIGVHVLNGSNYLFENCSFESFYATQIEDRVAVDKGDATISSCHFQSDSAAGRNILLTSGGGLKITDCKFLTSQDDILIQWTRGLSGGPIITGCSFENTTRNMINVTGDSVSGLNGLIISGNWFNGGTRQILIDNTVPLNNVNITGNVFKNGSATSMVTLGALVDGAIISGNRFDGTFVASSIGINIVNDPANVLIGDNQYVDLTSGAFSSTTSQTVFFGNDPLSMPNFLAFNSVTDDNVTGNGTTATVDFNTEVFDVGANFGSDTFTAPVTGKYLFTTAVRMDSISGATAINLRIVTSNNTYTFFQSAAATIENFRGSVIADMDQGDTARIDVSVNGVGSDSSDIFGDANRSTFFSGSLIA